MFKFFLEETMGINKVILIGNLGADPEVRYTNEQTAIANFSLATSERRRDANGNWTDFTEWHRIACFGKLAEFAKSYLTKGRQVYIEGKLRTSKWQDKDGKTRYTTEVVAGTIQFVGNAKDAANTTSRLTPEASFSAPQDEFGGDAAFAAPSLKSADSISEATFMDDDIPF